MPACHLNDSSEERRDDKYVLPPDEEGGVRVEGEPVQPRHQVEVPHLQIWITTAQSLSSLWVVVMMMVILMMVFTSRLVVCGSKTATLQLSECS